MLERTAGCLESGSLRRLVPGSRKVLKSRRMLHSSFWNHGAMDLESSPLWNALIRGPDLFDEQDEKNSSSPLNASARTFLDFLYPSGALKFLRQYSSWKSDKQDSQRLHAGFERFGQRLYTSLASEARHMVPDMLVARTNGEVSGLEDNIGVKNDGLEMPHSGSYGIVGTEVANDHGKAWRDFDANDLKSQPQLSPVLLAYLSTSNNRFDSERSERLFGQACNITNEEEYEWIIRSYLAAGHIEFAVRSYRQGLEMFDTPVASDILLAHILDCSQWQLAYDIWSSFQGFRDVRPALSYNIWKALDRLPSLPDRALGLTAFIKIELIKSTSKEFKSAASIFASALAHRTLLAMSAAESFETTKFIALLEVLQDLDHDIPERYESLISALVRSGHTKAALYSYREYRKRTAKKISRPILNAVLKVACQFGSVRGMQQVLDDWFRFYQKPSGATYRMCMSTFATSGDVQTVKALFERYMTKMTGEGKLSISRADDVAPLLHVHATRGELSEVLKIFDGMRENFDIEPNVKCWNILLNAYGKVHDVDGAFDRFQKLLDSPSLEPDSYTIGTMMGICTTRGDLDSTLELYQLAESKGIAKSAAMIDCLVLGHVQEDLLQLAEKICEDALRMGLKLPLTRMWNYLLMGYAMRRDLNNTNRILRRMRANGVEYDTSTYSALMQALAMVRQPDRARQILRTVMPEIGLRVTSFHYAVVIGGYIATGELQKVFQLHKEMLKRNIPQTSSTRLMTLRARAMEDQRLFESDTREAQVAKADQYFYEAYNIVDAQELVDTRRKGIGRQPLDLAYSSSYFGYLIFVYGQRGLSQGVEQLYERYMDSVPEKRREELPLKVLSALMTFNLKTKDYQAVQESWELAFQQAKKQGQPINFHNASENVVILPSHRMALAMHLSFQIASLSRQRKYSQLSRTVKDVEAAGFLLDNQNWNEYIQCLATSSDYRQAFELCESKLMDGWTGWARLRWMEPQSKRLLRELRDGKKQRSHLRPLYHTLLYLAKAYLELKDRGAGSLLGQYELEDVEERCPRTVKAVQMLRIVNDDDLERKILRKR